MPTPAEVLACPMDPKANDAGASSVKEYLVGLLRTLWVEAEGFDGKRPYGNSSWQFDVYADLGRAGLVDIVFDEDGYIDSGDTEGADRLILEAIDAL